MTALTHEQIDEIIDSHLETITLERGVEYTAKLSAMLHLQVHIAPAVMGLIASPDFQVAHAVKEKMARSFAGDFDHLSKAMLATWMDDMGLIENAAAEWLDGFIKDIKPIMEAVRRHE